MRVCQFRHDGKKPGCDPLLQAAFQEGLRVIFYRGTARCQTLGNDTLEDSIPENHTHRSRSAATENFAKPSDAIASLRVLVHDLGNSLDTVLQAAYLLQEANLEGKNKKWAQTIDAAARDARINREINTILASQR